MRPVVLILNTAHVQAHELAHIYRLHIHIVTSGKDLHIISLLRMNALIQIRGKVRGDVWRWELFRAYSPAVRGDRQIN